MLYCSKLIVILKKLLLNKNPFLKSRNKTLVSSHKEPFPTLCKSSKALNISSYGDRLHSASLFIILSKVILCNLLPAQCVWRNGESSSAGWRPYASPRRGQATHRARHVIKHIVSNPYESYWRHTSQECYTSLQNFCRGQRFAARIEDSLQSLAVVYIGIYMLIPDGIVWYTKE